VLLLPVGAVGGALLSGVVAFGAGELAEDPAGGASIAGGAVDCGAEALLALGHGVLLSGGGFFFCTLSRGCLLWGGAGHPPLWWVPGPLLAAYLRQYQL
jgi:hypothetical protein